MAIRIAIFEDNDALRESLVYLLKNASGYEVVGDYNNCLEAGTIVRVYEPDVVLMDIDMPGVNGIDGLKLIRQHNHKAKVLMLTVFDDNKNVFEALKSGANGYILKKTPPNKLLEYIQEASTGGAPMTASIATQVLQMFASLNNQQNDQYNLSDREKEVLQLLVNGYSYKMIASEMFIAIDTVRSHIKKIYEKLHVNSKSEAVAKAFKDRIL